MIPIQGLHHVSLNVRNLEVSKAFYRDVIGLKEIERPPFDFSGAWFAIGDTGQQLHLIVYEGETLRNGGIDSRDGHFAVRVESFNQTLAHLQGQGLEVDARPHARAGFPQIYVVDPDHNIIEFNAERLDEEK